MINITEIMIKALHKCKPLHKDELKVLNKILEFFSDGSRRGRIIVPKTIVRSATSIVKKARERLFGVRGAQIFNLFPANIREMNTEHVDTFKNHLDVFLSSIPDQPTVTGLGRGAETNSLLHQLPLFYNLTVK